MARVLVTDTAWASLDIEAGVLGAAGVDLVIAGPGSHEELVASAPSVDAILTCFAEVNAQVLDAAKRCVTVARYGVGVDNIDVVRATELGIVVTNVPDYCRHEVADHTLLLSLATLRRLHRHTRMVRAGGWDAATIPVPARVQNSVLGIVGLGAIANVVAHRAASFGFDLIAFDPHPPRRLPDGVRLVPSLEQLLGAADVVSLHVPMLPSTHHLIGTRELAAMKRSAVLVITSRGALVDTAALVDALENGRLAGAALDVTDPEPLPHDHPLRCRDDVLLTPHTAFSSDGSIAELCRRSAQHVVDVLGGKCPRNIVNPTVLASQDLRMHLASAQ